MTLQELIELIKAAGYIEEKQKKQLLTAVLHMESEDLSQLAKMMLWAEEQNKNLAIEGEFMQMGITEIMNQFNEQDIKDTEKEIMQISKEEDERESGESAKKLLSKLNDV